MDDKQHVLVAAKAGIAIRSRDDIIDAVAACHGAAGLLLTEEDLAPAFFDLKSGLAGELLQKFVNYRVRVAIVLPAPEAYGDRFQELAYEHQTHSLIRFVRSQAEAETWLERGSGLS